MSDENLDRVHDPLMSPLVWDLGHIAAFEDLWIGRELGDIVAAFGAWSAKDLAALNTELGAKKLQPIALISRAQWEGVGKGGQ